MQILIVEDEIQIAESLKKNLRDEGHNAMIAQDGEAALKLINEIEFDLLLLDSRMPKITGLEVCKQLRKQGNQTPIILLTALGDISNKIEAFNAGADDYITKPFNPKEVVLRVRNILKRFEKQKEFAIKTFNDGKIKINEKSFEMLIDGKKVNLTATEFKILIMLINKGGEVLTREEIIKKALGYDYEGYDRTVDAHIKNIRNKIKEVDDNLNCIQTVYGLGYRFTCKEDA
ncbi:TPA: response regulator transcription factor [bacterium]|nr:response regulator transcription factor [bacterium]